MIDAPGWRSPRMGKIGCYVIGLIGAPVDQSITSGPLTCMYICLVVLNSSWWGDPGEPTGQNASGNWVTKAILTVSKVGKQFKIESKDEGWFKNQNWVLGCRVWVGIGTGMGNITVSPLQCWRVRVRCLIFNTTAYTAPVPWCHGFFTVSSIYCKLSTYLNYQNK